MKYSLIIEATQDPRFFTFNSCDLKGFTGVGHSIKDCLCKAKKGMEEHVALLRERGLPVPEPDPNPIVTVQNEKQLRQQKVALKKGFGVWKAADHPDLGSPQEVSDLVHRLRGCQHSGRRLP